MIYKTHELLSIGEAAELKQVHQTSILRAAARGDLRSTLLGGKQFILRRSAEKWEPSRRGRKRKYDDPA